MSKVEEWHNSNSELPLHEFMGLTEQEYELFVKGDPVTTVSHSPIPVLGAVYVREEAYNIIKAENEST